MLSLVELKVKGFRSVCEEVVLPYVSGAFVIHGENGAGKTTLAEEALWWLLSGKAFRGDSIKDVINRDSKQAAVQASFTLASLTAPAVMKRTRTVKGATTFTFKTVDGTDLLAGAGTTSAALKSPIERLLNMPLSVVKATSFYAPERGLMGAEDAPRRKLLESALGLDWVADALEKAKVQHKQALGDLNLVRIDSTRAQAKLEALVTGVDAMRLQYEAAQRRSEADSKQGLAVITKSIATAEAVAVEHRKQHGIAEAQRTEIQVRLDALNLQVQSTQQKRSQLYNERCKLVGAQTALATSLLKAQAKARAIIPGQSCPTCDRPFTDADLKKAKDTTALEIAQASNTVKQYEQDLLLLDQGIKQLDATAGPGSALQQKAGLLTAEVQAAIQVAQQAGSIVSQTEAQLRNVLIPQRTKLENPTAVSGDVQALAEAVTKATTGAEDARKEVVGSLAKLAEVEQKEIHLRWWKTALGPKGLRAFILEGALPELSKAASYYVGLMSDFSLALVISPTKKKQDGSAAETLDIVVYNVHGINSAASNSTGERRMADIALALALHDMAVARGGRGLGFLGMDEALDALDENRARSVVEVLADLGKRGLAVGVISHSSAVRAHFPRSLHVYRGPDGWTRTRMLETT